MLHSDVHVVYPGIPSSRYCQRRLVGTLCVYSVYCAEKLYKQVQKNIL